MKYASYAWWYPLHAYLNSYLIAVDTKFQLGDAPGPPLLADRCLDFLLDESTTTHDDDGETMQKRIRKPAQDQQQEQREERQQQERGQLRLEKDEEEPQYQGQYHKESQRTVVMEAEDVFPSYDMAKDTNPSNEITSPEAHDVMGSDKNGQGKHNDADGNALGPNVIIGDLDDDQSLLLFDTDVINDTVVSSAENVEVLRISEGLARISCKQLSMCQ